MTLVVLESVTRHLTDNQVCTTINWDADLPLVKESQSRTGVAWKGSVFAAV